MSATDDHDPSDDPRTAVADELAGEADGGLSDTDDTDDTDDPEALDDDAQPMASFEPDPISAARRQYGTGGAMVAAGMFGLEIAMGKQKPDSVQVQEAPSDPVDVDKDGIQIDFDSTSVHAPALERRDPVGLHRKKRSR